MKNTTIKEIFSSITNELLGYNITANEGYTLHHTAHDVEVFDENGEPTGEIILGFTQDTIMVGSNYNFDKIKEDTYENISIEKVGKFELYTLPIGIVPNK